jgi:hypothetical protein
LAVLRAKVKRSSVIFKSKCLAILYAANPGLSKVPDLPYI